MFDLESYTLEQKRELECEKCGHAGKIKAIAKSGKIFTGIQVGKESGESGWEPTGSGWICPDCPTDQ